MRIAIYEPDPRICGPDTWAKMIQRGFLELGHSCDIVAFTKSGKSSLVWGRVLREEGLSASCTLRPTRVASIRHASSVLDEYDLIVLTDVKTATVDLPAYADGDLWPNYVEALSGTDTPFTSALHGKWYFEPEEKPSATNVERGSPFLGDLLSLPNFTGFLIEHAPNGLFSALSSRLQSCDRLYLPLPYRCQVASMDLKAERAPRTLCALGRVVKIKYRQLINALARAGRLPGWDIEYGGATSVTYGPSDSYVLYEGLMLGEDRTGTDSKVSNAESMAGTDGWSGSREGGVRRTTCWDVAGPNGEKISYTGAYDNPVHVAGNRRVHSGITCCEFSGGLLEFSTLEAIDSGCLPIVTRPFVLDQYPDLRVEVLEHNITGKFKNPPQEWLDDLHTSIIRADQDWTIETAMANRKVIDERHNPGLHAQAFLGSLSK